MNQNNQYSASSLFAGGWRSSDSLELMDEFNLTKEEASELCDQLKAIEADFIIYNGKEYLFESAVSLMDDEIRETLHHLYAPCTNQFFFDKYVTAHFQKYGEDFIIE